jgi:hypothetical protein
MNTVGFLRKYIKENQDLTFEEVLNDEEFLEELRIKDEIFLE